MWFQKPCFPVISIPSIGQKWQTCFLGYFPNKNSSKGYQLESWKQKRFQHDWGQNRGFWTSQVHSWGFQSLMAPSLEFFNVKTPLDGLESKNKTWWYIVVLFKNWWQYHHCLYILITNWNHIFFKVLKGLPEFKINLQEIKNDLPELKNDLPELKNNLPVLKNDLTKLKVVVWAKIF